MGSTMTKVQKVYFRYLTSFVGRSLGPYSMEQLLEYLFNRKFIPDDEYDEGRYSDGIQMRYECEVDTGVNPEKGPANMLEVMVALSRRIENVMSSVQFGDRTHQWFWRMITSLGLTGMYDGAFNKEFADEIMDHFDQKEYLNDGYGSLFWVPGIDLDMRELDIWSQASQYLNRCPI